MSILRELERRLVLPLRFLVHHRKDCRELRQKCKVCGQSDGFNFNVSDDVWKNVVPKRFQNRVVCLRCFDEFAAQKGMDYTGAITQLSFAGVQASFDVITLSKTGIDKSAYLNNKSRSINLESQESERDDIR